MLIDIVGIESPRRVFYFYIEVSTDDKKRKRQQVKHGQMTGNLGHKMANETLKVKLDITKSTKITIRITEVEELVTAFNTTFFYEFNATKVLEEGSNGRVQSVSLMKRVGKVKQDSGTTVSIKATVNCADCNVH